MTTVLTAGLEPEVMGAPQPDEQRTDVMGGRNPDSDLMGGPQPDEQRTDVMGGRNPDSDLMGGPQPDGLYTDVMRTRAMRSRGWQPARGR